MSELKKSYISINGHVIRRNKTHGENAPPIRIAASRSDAKPRYAHAIRINGPSALYYDGLPILKCGARLVLTALTCDVEILR